MIDDLSLARGVFAVAIKASELLNTDEGLRKEWQESLGYEYYIVPKWRTGRNDTGT